MVKLNKIYTRTGDSGETSLVNGMRVSKHARRPSAFGEVDEANSVIGLARLQCSDNAEADEMLARIQNDLFDLVVVECACSLRNANVERIHEIQRSKFREYVMLFYKVLVRQKSAEEFKHVSERRRRPSCALCSTAAGVSKEPFQSKPADHTRNSRVRGHEPPEYA